VTLVVVLFVVVGSLLGVAGLRLAQMPCGALARAARAAGHRCRDDRARGEQRRLVVLLGAAVQDVLSAYFDAINTKNYAAWAATVTPARAAQQPEAAWQQGYASNRRRHHPAQPDRRGGPGRLVAMVSY